MAHLAQEIRAKQNIKALPWNETHSAHSHPQPPTEAGMMESWILLMLGFAIPATALSPTPEELTYKEAVSLAIDLYNQEPEVEWAFRLLDAKPQPEWDPSLQSRQELGFTVQETTCQPSKQLNLDECDFKEDGVVMECSGTIFPKQGAPIIEFSCETAGQEHTRVRRGTVRRLAKKLRKGIKKLTRRRG